jgi:hypothetical protein
VSYSSSHIFKNFEAKCCQNAKRGKKKKIKPKCLERKNREINQMLRKREKKGGEGGRAAERKRKRKKRKEKKE